MHICYFCNRCLCVHLNPAVFGPVHLFATFRELSWFNTSVRVSSLWLHLTLQSGRTVQRFGLRRTLLSCGRPVSLCQWQLAQLPAAFLSSCRQLQKQKRDQERREFEALQEQGLNPYEVYRCVMVPS
jgi:hypothetical protein